MSSAVGQELHDRALRDLTRVDPETGDLPGMRGLRGQQEDEDDTSRRFRSMG